MFKRFTPDARQAMVRAEQEARAFAHPWIGTEHILLGVLAASDAPAAALLVDHGVTLDTARVALDELVGRGGFGAKDADALRAVGIDLDQVRRAAEAAFGPGALDRPPAWRCRSRSRLRRLRQQPTSAADELRFMPRAKRALERASIETGQADVGLDHLLLGLLDPKGNMAVELIRHLCAEPDLLRAQVRSRLEDAA